MYFVNSEFVFIFATDDWNFENLCISFLFFRQQLILLIRYFSSYAVCKPFPNCFFASFSKRVPICNLPIIWKWFDLNRQEKLISLWQVVDQDSFWNEGKSNSWNGLFMIENFVVVPLIYVVCFQFFQSSGGESFPTQSHCNGTSPSSCSVTPVCGLLPVQRGKVSHNSFKVILDHLPLSAIVKFTATYCCSFFSGAEDGGVRFPLLHVCTGDI